MAKAAAKETSLPVVVSLVFFVLATIGLGVFVYVLYSDQEAKDTEVAKAKDEVKGLRAEAKEKELIARAYRVFAGIPETDDLSTLTQDVKEGDKVHQELKKAADAVKKKVPELTKSQADRFNAAVAAYAKDPSAATTPLDPLKLGLADPDVWGGEVEGGQLKAPPPGKTLLDFAARAAVQRNLAMDASAAGRDKYEKTVETLATQATGFKKSSDTFDQTTTMVKNKLTEQIDTLKKELDDRTQAFQVEAKKYRDDIAKLTEDIEKLDAKNRRLKEDFDRLREARDALVKKIAPPDPLKNEEPQGKILRRLQNNVVEIDLGSAALVTPGLTFEVEPIDFLEKGRQSRVRAVRIPDDRGVMKTQEIFIPKGSIEVIEVIGPNLSRARVTGEAEPVREAVMAGDLLFNAAWKRGVGEHIALLGVFDINGDGTDDVEAVERDLKRMGVHVDAVFDLRTGTWRGRLTDRTSKVVEGYQIPVSANDPHQAAKAALISKMGAAREEIRLKAIQIVRFDDFFGRIGYRVNTHVPEDRISQAVARYFAAVGNNPMPTPPKD